MPGAAKKLDDFELVNVVANGHSSEVWEVRDGAGGIHAVKRLRPDHFKDPTHVSTLKHEAKVAQAIEHPTIIRVHRFVKTKTDCYMLMEYFECPNVKSFMKNDLRRLRAQVPQLVEQLTTALGFMHEKGWLHHDLKPDNILFNSSGEMKLVDFSLSMRRKGNLTKAVAGKVKMVRGTRTYIAPETIRKEYPSQQTDIYSMGVTLYEILAGQAPFISSNPDDLLKKHLHEAPTEPSYYNANLTPEADEALFRLLAKKPDKRPQDMTEVAAAFRSLKLFKTDPLELLREEEARLKEGGAGLDAGSRLDSRADAKRTAAGVAAPAKPSTRKPTARALELARKAGLDIPEHLRDENEAREPAPQQQQQQQQAWPGQWPGYGAQGNPQGYPQQYWPQQPPPQQPQQGYYPYQYPAPGQYQQPQAPPPQAPPPQAPSQPATLPGQGGDVAARPPEAPAAANAPAVPADQPPAAEPPQSREEEAKRKQREQRRADEHIPPGQGRGSERHPTQDHVDDPDSLPLMDELPDVL